MSLVDLLVGGPQKVLQVSGGCHNCPRKRVGFVPASLQGGSVIFVGDGPGETDVAMGQPFAGSTSEHLKALLAEYSVPGPHSFTMIAHCKAPSEKADPKAVSCCMSQFVIDEIRNYSIVVLAGTTALQAFFPGAKADHMRGNFAHHPDFPEQRFYTMYSPSYVVRRPDVEPEFRQQVARLGRVMRGEGAELDFTVITGPRAAAALRKMLESPLVSGDLETNRLESWVQGGRIKSLAVTADAKTVVAAHEDEPHFKECLDLFVEFLSKPEKSVVGAHIAFDLDWMEKETGIIVRCQLIHDVTIQYYHFKQYQMPSLKELVARELDGYRYLVHNPHEIQNTSLLLKYNAEDVVYPLLLMRRAMKELKPKTRDLTARVQGPAALVLQRISSNGMYMRESYRQEMIDKYREKRRTAIASWKAEDPEFIPTVHESGDGLLHYLFRMRGMPVLQETAKNSGVPSTDKSVLKELQRQGFGIVQHLMDIREIDKIESTYLTAYDKHLWPDSRIRSHFPLTWTDSGRSSSRTPNMQNIPRKKEIRNLFGAPPGSLLLESDLSQIEFRIMVCLARDDNGIAGYMRNEDAHTMTARKASGQDKPTKEQRSQAKPINFGFLYGAHWKMVQMLVADDYGVLWTDEQAEGFREMFFDTYPALPVFHANRKQLLQQNRGWFESSVGHIFHYKEWDHADKKRQDHAARAALNAEAQGPAAQLCMYIMVIARRLLDERGFRSVKFVNHVHDSLMAEIPNPAWVQDVVATIEEAKNEAYKWVQSWFVVPLLMEHSIGEAWGSLEEVKL